MGRLQMTDMHCVTQCSCARTATGHYAISFSVSSGPEGTTRRVKKSPFTIRHKWSEMGGGGGLLCPGARRPKIFFQVGCPSLFTVAVGPGLGGGGVPVQHVSPRADTNCSKNPYATFWEQAAEWA